MRTALYRVARDILRLSSFCLCQTEDLIFDFLIFPHKRTFKLTTIQHPFSRINVMLGVDYDLYHIKTTVHICSVALLGILRQAIQWNFNAYTLQHIVLCLW